MKKTITAKSKTNKMYIGAALLLGGLFMANAQKKPQSFTPREPIEPLRPLQPNGTVNTTTRPKHVTVTNPVITPTIIGLDRNKLLKRGSNNNEVRELQRLLRILPMDGIFGNGTATALLRQKGLTETTLNQFDRTAAPIINSSFSGFKVGDTVRAKMFTVPVYKVTETASSYFTSQVWDRVYVTGEIIGTILKIVPNSDNLIIKKNDPFAATPIVWVASTQVKK